MFATQIFNRLNYPIKITCNELFIKNLLFMVLKIILNYLAAMPAYAIYT